MCGILCVLNSTESGDLLNQKVAQLSKRQNHRGPDERGIYTKGNCTLAHERLSIVDLEHGRQPIHNEDHTLTLVCNGEIYNHQSLHPKLKKSHQFSTRSDSEVILHLYEDYGPECVTFLDGMFAFVIMGKNGEFFAARDPIGIKPLFVGTGRDGSKWFSSEIKTIVDQCEKVEKFPIGNYWTPSEGYVQYSFPSWWDDQKVPRKPADLPLIAKKFEEAVVKRLMGDVEVGVFLSGGLDSSLVAAMAKKHVDKLHSFSIGVQSSELSPDLEAARKVARHIGSIHHEKIFTIEEGINAVEKVIYHHETYDAGSIRSGCAMYLLCQLVSEHVKVCLSGEGSDEVFAGYLFFSETEDPAELHKETVQRIKNLQSIQLQFNDRLGMAHSVEVRVPFLDLDFLDVCMNIDPSSKLSKNVIEKEILRSAFKGVIPDEVLWRQKEHFGDGVGYTWIDTLKETCEQRVTDAEFATAEERFPFDTPRTKEQFYYRNIFDKYFPNSIADHTVRKWLPWTSKGESTVDPSPRYHTKQHKSSQV